MTVRIGSVIALPLFVAGCSQKSELDSVYSQVSDDAVTQYEIASRQGDPAQICLQARMAAAAYLQAKDEGNFQRWKATEKEACK